MITDLESRIEQPIKDALYMAETSIENIDQVVLMGAGTRVPKVQEILTKAIGGKVRPSTYRITISFAF